MPRSGPRTVRKYSDEFKLTAVRLSQQPGVQVKRVASALAIHPFMLSRHSLRANSDYCAVGLTNHASYDHRGHGGRIHRRHNQPSPAT